MGPLLRVPQRAKIRAAHQGRAANIREFVVSRVYIYIYTSQGEIVALEYKDRIVYVCVYVHTAITTCLLYARAFVLFPERDAIKMSDTAAAAGGSKLKLAVRRVLCGYIYISLLL